MMLWLALTAMVAVAAVFAAAPFIRRHERARLASESSLAVYRDQLREVDAEAAQGAIDATQAESARIEIKRRMLAVGHSEEDAWPALSGGERAFAAAAVSAVVVIGSAILFAFTADLDQPMRTASVEPDSSDVRSLQRLWNQPAQGDVPAASASAAAAAPRSASALPPVDELIQRLATRLQRNPKDADGWRMLGWSYFSMERFAEAADAYARAIEINPDSLDYRDGRLESLLRAAKGVVTNDVKTAMEETLKLQPTDTRALFVKGLAIEQGGDRAGAEKIWRDLQRTIDPNDPWAKEIEQKLGGETRAVLAAPVAPTAIAPPAAAAPATALRGPTPADVRAAEAMSAGDRVAMIQRMVDGLADRLKDNPRDADGWIRLVRSWTVLGEPDKARKALDEATKIFADDPTQARRIVAAAEEAGLKR